MKKLFKNIGASALPQIMNIITNLILPSYMIFRFGSEINGLVSSIKIIIVYISIVGAGIATATTQALYKPVAKKDTKTIKGMLNATNKMFNKYGVIFCIIAFVTAFIYPFIIKSNLNYYLVVLLMLVMSLSGMSEFFAIGRSRSLLYADQKTYVCTTIQAISIFLSLVFAIILLKLNAGIVLVQLVISMVYVFRAFFLVKYIKKNYPELSDYKKSKPIYSATSKKNDAMIHQVSGLAVFNSQTIILSIFVGLNAVSIYSVYNIVFSGIQSILSNLNTAITPYLGREYALKNTNRIKKMYDLIEFSFFYITAFIFSITIMLIVPFVKLYTNGADINYEYPIFAIIFAFTIAFCILKMPANSLINVSGLFKETRWRAIIEGAITIVFGILFTLLFGLSGVVMGTLIALAWRCLDTIIYTNKYVLNNSNKKSFSRLFIVVIFLIIFACFSLKINLNILSYFDWILYGLIFSLINMIILIIIAVIFDKKTIIYAIKSLKARIKKENNLPLSD